MHFYVHLPCVNMREEPALNSKMVSQALFGEEIVPLREKDGWVWIQTPDGYCGWVREGGYTERKELYLGDLEIARLRAHVYSCADTEYGPLLTLPYGSKLHSTDRSDLRWDEVLLPCGKRGYVQKGDVSHEPFDLVSFSKKFLGLPYTWGGRSSFGYDCSGFVQMVYRKLGILLPRDAREQILDPRCQEVEDLFLGDLIFWGKSEREIRHVGIYLGKEEFIHTSSRENLPFLRISRLSEFEWSGQKGAFYPFRTARRINLQLDKA